MTLNKKILAAAIVGGLFAGSAQAAVNISNTNPADAPVRIANEAVIPATGLVVANDTNTLDLTTALNYSFSDGEVRYARIECSSNMRFLAGSAVVPSDAVSTQVGAINGLNTNVITFSVTAAGADLTSTDTLTINGTRRLMSNGAVSCSYGLYDQPSQAAAGGTAGRIASASGNYLVFADSYALVTDPGTNVANVEALPTFTEFTAASAAPDTAAIGAFWYGKVEDMPGASAPATNPINPADGQEMELADLMGANTALLFTGDFSIAANASGEFDPADQNVFLASDDNCTYFDDLDDLTDEEAVYVVGANDALGLRLCMINATGDAIPVSDYTVSVDTAAANANVAVTDIGPRDLGSIIRNGTELQAPLAQVPAGWLSRMVLTNTGSIARPYTISLMGETGRTFDTDNLTGTVPANGTVVVDLNRVMSNFNGNPRATLNVTVAGPNNQIQGLYQIVNPAAGSISNHVMVRPGQN